MSKQATPNLIGFAGGPGAGKDTAAGLLATHHGFRQHAFADALRDFTYVIDPGWRMAFDLHGYHDAKTLVGGFRERIVEIGEAAKAWVSPTIWVDALEERITRDLTDGHSVVVSDVRFSPEADLIRDYGGIVVGIERPHHSPENDEAWSVYLGADDWLFNDGSMVDLWDQVDSLVETLSHVRK